MASNSAPSHRTSTDSENAHYTYSDSDFASTAHHSLTASVYNSNNTDNGGFTMRAVISGLLIGVLVNVSNTYYGLRVGAGGQMSMISALLGYIGFKILPRSTSLSPAENVLLVSVATATGCMPITAGLIQTIPALEYLIGPNERGPLHENVGSLIIWSIGVSFFGIIFTALLRGQLVEKDLKLPWPGASATAHLISTLHRTIPKSSDTAGAVNAPRGSNDTQWRTQLRGLLQGSFLSGIMCVLINFFPILHDIPVFGHQAKYWLWTVDLSPGFFGQGMIMGPYISMHMLSGAIVGWAILSPLAKRKDWAPGDVDDWSTGSRGWIIWVSLASLLADSSVKLAWVALQPLWNEYGGFRQAITTLKVFWTDHVRYRLIRSTQRDYLQIATETILNQESPRDSPDLPGNTPPASPALPQGRPGIPLGRKISPRILVLYFLLSLIICILTTRHVFGDFMPWRFTPLAIALSLPMAAVGIRSLAETDYNPDSAIVSQLVFAVLISHTNPSAIIMNLISAGLAVAGANQAGDLAYDLKVGNLVGASPQAQIQGQLVGSVFGALLSCGTYKLYSSHYPIPGSLFRVPSAYLVLSTARLLLGQGLPTGVLPFVIGAAVISAITTIVKMRYESRWWQGYIPSGVAFAMGIYLLPSFSVTRALGGLFYSIYTHRKRNSASNITLLASGLVIGEAVTSFLSVAFTALHVSTDVK